MIFTMFPDVFEPNAILYSILLYLPEGSVKKLLKITYRARDFRPVAASRDGVVVAHEVVGGLHADHGEGDAQLAGYNLGNL